MLNKIFVVLLAVAIVTMSVLTFFSYNWLLSVDKPVNVIANYDMYSGIAWTFLWISAVILLIVANVLLWTNRSIWSLWLSFLYFAVFLLLNTFWVGEAAFAYKKANGLTDSFISFTGIIAAVMCVVIGVGIFFDQFIVLRLRDKMTNKPQENVVEDSEVIENKSDKIS